jgi:hypothetical protein
MDACSNLKVFLSLFLCVPFGCLCTEQNKLVALDGSPAYRLACSAKDSCCKKKQRLISRLKAGVAVLVPVVVGLVVRGEWLRRDLAKERKSVASLTQDLEINSVLLEKVAGRAEERRDSVEVVIPEAEEGGFSLGGDETVESFGRSSENVLEPEGSVEFLGQEPEEACDLFSGSQEGPEIVEVFVDVLIPELEKNDDLLGKPEEGAGSVEGSVELLRQESDNGLKSEGSVEALGQWPESNFGLSEKPYQDPESLGWEEVFADD